MLVFQKARSLRFASLAHLAPFTVEDRHFQAAEDEEELQPNPHLDDEHPQRLVEDGDVAEDGHVVENVEGDAEEGGSVGELGDAEISDAVGKLPGVVLLPLRTEEAELETQLSDQS